MASRSPPQAPPHFTTIPASILDDAKNLIEQSRSIQNQIIESVQPSAATFANTLLPLAYAENVASLQSTILGFYKLVSPDPELRNASIAAKRLLDEFEVESAMREDLFLLVDAVFRQNEDLDTEDLQFMRKKHREYIKNGLKLPAGKKRGRFRQLKMKIKQLTDEFRQNIVEDDSGIWLDRSELNGLPIGVLFGLEDGQGENVGRVRLPLNNPEFYTAMRYIRSGETRKKIYIAHENKLSINMPIFKKVMVFRDESARLLGYKNHAGFRLEDKMAKTPETVNSFLDDLWRKLETGSMRDLARLKDLKKIDLAIRVGDEGYGHFTERDSAVGLPKQPTLDTRGESSDIHFMSWDLSFYNRSMLETQYQVDQEKISEYFPLDSTVEGMLKIFEDLFGLIFLQIHETESNYSEDSRQRSDLAWHENVQLFEVWDDEREGGEFVGYLYLDLYPRQGKWGNASSHLLQPGFLRQDSTRHYPTTAVVCSFSKPTPKKPSLLIQLEVVTLFHELGHGIHDLASKTKYSRFHGTNVVIDFGEAPSQMLENWCWDPTILKSLSRHYSATSPAHSRVTPPEKIPDEIIDNLIAAKNINAAVSAMSQLHLGMFDMLVHQPESHEETERMNISVEYNALRKKLSGIDGPESLGLGGEWGHGQANFGHLMGDYDVGYYGYLSSQVYSADMYFTVFKDDPMNAEEGRRYRHTVLEKGGSQDEMKTLTEFLGRELDTGAFYQQLGLC